jgi:hypothetical protein
LPISIKFVDFQTVTFWKCSNEKRRARLPDAARADGSLFQERAGDVGDRQQRDIHHCNFATWNGDVGAKVMTTSGALTATSATDQFTYSATAPAVTSISPNSGPPVGGTSVTITRGANVD